MVLMVQGCSAGAAGHCRSVLRGLMLACIIQLRMLQCRTVARHCAISYATCALLSSPQNLTHEAIRKRNSRDNVSVILIILNKWY